MTIDFGVTYSNLSQDEDSSVYLSSYPTTGSYAFWGQRATPTTPRDIRGLFISDNSNQREFTFLVASGTFGSQFRIYDVLVTGTSTNLTLRNATNYTTSGTVISTTVTKKVSDSEYISYYVTAQSSDIQIRKRTVTPSVGYTDTVVHAFTDRADAAIILSWRHFDIRVFGKTIYFLWGKRLTSPCVSFDVYLSSFDCESESFSDSNVWSATDDGTQKMTAVNDNDAAGSLVMSGGTLHWAVFFYRRLNTVSGYFKGYVTIDGNESSSLFQVDYGIDIFFFPTATLKTIQYNNVHYLWVAQYTITITNPDHIYRTVINTSNTPSTNGGSGIPFPQDIIYPYQDVSKETKIPKFNSTLANPCISFSSGSAYYFVNPSDGTAISQLAPTGYNIRAIYPTLDSQTGYIYAEAENPPGSGDTNLISMDTSGNVINKYDMQFQSNLGAIASTEHYNHGNFFINARDTVVTVNYLPNFLGVVQAGVNDVQMIIEQN